LICLGILGPDHDTTNSRRANDPCLTPILEPVWELDPANSRDLIDRLRPHARRFTLKTVYVGQGWRPLVEECH
jgi:hypothetical protein